MKYNKILKKSIKIYCDNTDKYSSGEALWEFILEAAKEFGLSGATVYKGVAGIGETNTIHRFDFLNIANTMPIIIEIIDDSDKIEAFLDELDIDIKELYIVMKDVEVLV